MWLYQDRELTEEEIKNHIGFVYLIENLSNGKKYIGKKLFRSARTKKPLKGKVNKRRSKVDSGWRDYWGSNNLLLEDVEIFGSDSFSRKILHLCKTKGTANYLEMKEQILNNALEADNYYNEWIFCKVHRSQIKL